MSNSPKIFNKRHHLSTKTAFKIGCSNFKLHIFRFISTVILAVISFTLIGLTVAYATLDGTNNYVNTIYEDSGAQYVLINKYIASEDKGDLGLNAIFGRKNNNKTSIQAINQSDLDFLQSFVSEPLMLISMVNETVSGLPYSDKSPQTSEHITKTFSGFMTISKEICDRNGYELIGRLPVTKNEIAITDCMFNSLKYCGYFDSENETGKLETPNDLIGQKLNVWSTYKPLVLGAFNYVSFDDTIITGIVKTGCDKNCSETNHPYIPKYNSSGHEIPCDYEHNPEFYQADNEYLFHDKVFVSKTFAFEMMDEMDYEIPYEIICKTGILMPLPKDKKEFVNLIRYMTKVNSTQIVYPFYQICTATPKTNISGDFPKYISYSEYFFACRSHGRMLSLLTLYVGIIFSVFSLLFLVNFINTSIRSQMKQIGIMTSLGATLRNIFTIYFLSSLSLCGIVFVLSAITTGVIIEVLNVTGMATLWLNAGKYPIKILSLNIWVILALLLTAVITAFIGTAISLIKYRKLSPAEIIRKGQIK